MYVHCHSDNVQYLLYVREQNQRTEFSAIIEIKSREREYFCSSKAEKNEIKIALNWMMWTLPFKLFTSYIRYNYEQGNIE